MKQKFGAVKAPAEEVLKDIRRQTRRHYSAEDKIRIRLKGLRGEESIVLSLSVRVERRPQFLLLVQRASGGLGGRLVGASR